MYMRGSRKFYQWGPKFRLFGVFFFGHHTLRRESLQIFLVATIALPASAISTVFHWWVNDGMIFQGIRTPVSTSRSARDHSENKKIICVKLLLFSYPSV